MISSNLQATVAVIAVSAAAWHGIVTTKWLDGVATITNKDNEIVELEVDRESAIASMIYFDSRFRSLAARIDAEILQINQSELKLRLRLAGATRDETFAAATSPATCPERERRVPELTATGTVFYMERVALPPSAVVRIELRDDSRGNAAADPLAAASIGIVPLRLAPISSIDRQALTNLLTPVWASASEIDEKALAPADVIVLRTIRFGLGRTHDELSRRPALRLDPLFVPAYVNLAELARTSKGESEAEGVLRDGLAQVPDAAALHHSLGLALVRQERAPGRDGEGQLPRLVRHDLLSHLRAEEP